MNQYYLMAQLPSLDCIGESSPCPITEERYNELCRRFLSKKALKALDNITLSPSRHYKPVGFKLIDEWNEGERRLRLALANARAEKMKKSFDEKSPVIPSQMAQAIKAAVETTDPMEAEKLLDRYRIGFLETLRPSDAFSEDAAIFYGIKLKLMMRVRQFDAEKGRESYRNIYNSIINNNRQEATQ